MHVSRLFCAALVTLATGGCAVAPQAQTRAAAAPIRAAAVRSHAAPACVEYGLASWYRAAPGQRRTAGGGTYRAANLTAAHPFLPFGTEVRVTDLDNDRSVIVRIDDRGPFVPGRIIDLSVAAAHRLGIRHRGVSHVRLLAVPGGSGTLPLTVGAGPLPSCAPGRGMGRA